MRILNSAKEKKKERKPYSIQWNFKQLSIDFSGKILQIKRQWDDIFKVLNGKTNKQTKKTAYQLRILYLAKVSYKMRENLSRQTEERELITTRPLVL